MKPKRDLKSKFKMVAGPIYYMWYGDFNPDASYWMIQNKSLRKKGLRLESKD